MMNLEHQHNRFEHTNCKNKIVEGREFYDCHFYKSAADNFIVPKTNKIKQAN